MSFTIVRHLMTTGEPLVLVKCKTPQDSLREARRIVNESGLDGVSIVDDGSGVSLDIAMFAARHRLS